MNVHVRGLLIAGIQQPSRSGESFAVVAPADGRVIALAGSLQNQQGRQELAEVLLQHGLQLSPQSLLVRSQLVSFYLQQDKQDNALQLLLQVLRTRVRHAFSALHLDR